MDRDTPFPPSILSTIRYSTASTGYPPMDLAKKFPLRGLLRMSTAELEQMLMARAERAV